MHVIGRRESPYRVGPIRIGLNFPEAAAFSSLRSPFFTMIRTNPKPVSNMFNFFPAVNWLTSGFVYAFLSLNWLSVPCTNHSYSKKCNEQRSEILDKESCIKEQIYFELLYVNCIQFTS